MSYKTLSLLLLTLVLSLTVVSAATFTLSSNTLTFTEPDTSATFTITPSSTPKTYQLTVPAINDDDGDAIIFNVPSEVTVTSGTQTITINTSVDFDDLTVGETYSGTLLIKDKNNNSDNQTISVSFEPSFCEAGEAFTNDFELAITDFNLDNNDGDDEEWSPLDEITIDIEVSNEGDEKVKDVVVEIDLFDSEGDSIINDLEFEGSDEEQIDLGSIKDGDEKDVEFKFTVPADFEAESYKLVIKAYGDDEGEDIVCSAESSELDNDLYQSIDGEREEDEEDHIVVNEIRVSPDVAQCGERVQVQGEVFNIGDSDYEDQVKVTLEIKELGIDLEKIVREDFDEGDSSDVEFEFDIPQDADEKSYTMELRTYYDYNDRLDVYEIVSDRKFTNIISPFRVEGDCIGGGSSGGDNGVIMGSNAQITAQLDPDTPEAVAGEEVIIRATLRNTGDEVTTYTISVSGNSAWSDLVSVNPQIVTDLRPGASRDVEIILDVDDDVSGDKRFIIRASYDDQVTEREVELLGIAGDKAESDAFVEHMRNNWFIYVIIIINIILIIAIISVVRRMLAPRPM